MAVGVALGPCGGRDQHTEWGELDGGRTGLFLSRLVTDGMPSGAADEAAGQKRPSPRDGAAYFWQQILLWYALMP